MRVGGVVKENLPGSANMTFPFSSRSRLIPGKKYILGPQLLLHEP